MCLNVFLPDLIQGNDHRWTTTFHSSLALPSLSRSFDKELEANWWGMLSVVHKHSWTQWGKYCDKDARDWVQLFSEPFSFIVSECLIHFRPMSCRSWLPLTTAQVLLWMQIRGKPQELFQHRCCSRWGQKSKRCHQRWVMRSRKWKARKIRRTTKKKNRKKRKKGRKRKNTKNMISKQPADNAQSVLSTLMWLCWQKKSIIDNWHDWGFQKLNSIELSQPTDWQLIKSWMLSHVRNAPMMPCHVMFLWPKSSVKSSLMS